MKFLILGCNGMAGHTVSLYLKERGHEVLGLARRESLLVKTVICDIADLKNLKDIIGTNRFDCIINCIGILNQGAENNKAAAVFSNSYLPHYLSEITSKTHTQIIHMSTDCVFSGKKGQYTENDFPDGNTFYDKSKALGELNEEKNLTLRNSIVGPDLNPNGIGLLNWFLQQKTDINGFVKAIWTGQTTLQLAKTMEFAAKERLSGLFNAVPDAFISKFELLKLFNHYFRKDRLKIIPVDNIAVADKSLKCTKFNGYEIPDYDKLVCELAEWMRLHNDLYPHYYLKVKE